MQNENALHILFKNFEYHYDHPTFKMFGHKTGVNILRNIGHWTPASQSSDLVITRMITDQIGLHSVPVYW